MFISDFAIKRPIVTVTVMVALVVFGVIALLALQVDEFPDVAEPIVAVQVPYPGASPDQVEREILEPMEEAIAGISGVKHVTGQARDGFAQIIIQYAFEKPIGEQTQDVRDKISLIRADLPQEMKEPIIQRFSPTERPVVLLALVSDKLTPAQLTRIADPGITRELRSLNGVSQVNVLGKVEREMTVLLKPQALQASGVSVSQVVTALSLQNLAAPVGRLTGLADERTIRLKGRPEGPSDFMQIAVTERGGQLIRLGQVADVLDGTEESRSLAQVDGKDAVGIELSKSKGVSTADVCAAILKRIAVIQARLPADAKLIVLKNAGVRVEASVRNVQEALLQGAFLTVLVVFLFLNSWRSTVITGLALPVSVLASFVAVWAFGFTLNTMSLLGLSLAIGILIDDAIVVRENIVRHVELGSDHFTAAHEGTNEIGLAVTATTFSIIAVFVPVAFLSGTSGQWFKPFALTIACSVLVSLFVSFSLDPMLSAYWPDPHIEESKRWWISRILAKFNRWFNRQAERYKKVVAWALDHRLAMIGIAAGSFVIALALPAIGLVGVAFVPVMDNSELNVGIDSPPGSNLAYTAAKAEQIARIVRNNPEVKYTYTTVGGQLGAVDAANVYARLTPKNTRKRSATDLAVALRREIKKIGGVTAAVFSSDWGGNIKEVEFQLRGNDMTELAAAAQSVMAEAKQVQGAADVDLSTKGQKPELDVQIDRGLASSLGLTVGQVAQALRPAFAGVDAGDWVDPSGETRKVRVRFAPESRRHISDLEQLPLVVLGANGLPTTLPLGQVARVRENLGPAIINHLDRDKVVSVQMNTANRSTGEVTRDVQTRIAKLHLPPSVRVTLGAQAEQQSEVFGKMFLALAVAVLFMYLILVIQFGSFVDPLAIMISLPLSLIGVMLALMITKTSINIMSLIGVILLMGIVAKNAILLIDFAKWARERDGLPLREALIQAGAIRLRPILMTTFALIAGMIPVALGRGEGSQFRAPLGVAVIGGVITSTFLTLIAIPTFYEILSEGSEALSHFVSRISRRRAPAPTPALTEET